MGFDALNIPANLLKKLERQNITVPSPIQEQAIPPALEGKDLIGIAQTGTGKTLAFALPMVNRLGRDQVGLILAPTRELAYQIAETYTKLGQEVAVVVGGESMYNQVQTLRRRPAIVVATPGRLIDHMDRRTIRMDAIRMVVLDEADRMLDMGFAPAIKRILDSIRYNEQTMLFSATMPSEITELAESYLVDPIRIEIAPQGTVTDLVDHQILYLNFEEKKPTAVQFIESIDGPILIFTRTKHGARKLCKSLNADGFSSAEIHANRTLPQRREALAGFKSGKYKVLVATDVAARGIDVKNIGLVINFDIPECAEDYVHRIGRTGRAGAKGLAISFVLSNQVPFIKAIERLMSLELEISPLSTAIPKSQKGGVKAANQKNPFRDQRFKSDKKAPKAKEKAKHIPEYVAEAQVPISQPEPQRERLMNSNRRDSRNPNSDSRSDSRPSQSRYGDNRNRDSRNTTSRDNSRRQDSRNYDQRGPEPRGRESRNYDQRGYESRGQDSRGYDRGYQSRDQESRGYNQRNYDSRGQEPRSYEQRGHEPRNYDNRPSESGRRYEDRPRQYDSRSGNHRGDQRENGFRSRSKSSENSRSQPRNTRPAQESPKEGWFEKRYGQARNRPNNDYIPSQEERTRPQGSREEQSLPRFKKSAAKRAKGDVGGAPKLKPKFKGKKFEGSSKPKKARHKRK